MSSGKKIVRLFSRLNVGGPALHVVNLSKGLREYGYETVLGVGLPDATEGSMESYAEDQGVALVHVDGFQAAVSPLRDLRAAIEIFRLIRRERPTIVHTHTFKAGLLGRIAARLAGVPIVLHTYHGHLLQGYWTGWKAKIIIWLERRLSRWTDKVIAVSDQVGEDLVEAGVVPRTKVSVIRLGFDMRRFQEELILPSTLRSRLGIPASGAVVGIVGRLVPVKNVSLFLEGLCPLLDSFPDLHLVVVGDGIERTKLENAADMTCGSPAIRGRVHFTGFIMPMASEWKDIDLCVCTSKNEGTSVSTIEAVMAGVPVLSTAVGGMPDLLENGKWGRLIAQSPEDLRAAVQEWLCDRSPPPAAAARIFQERFSTDRLLAETERLYREISP